MTWQERKDFAIKTLVENKNPLITEFCGVDINEFTKEELIKILSMQNQMWLRSLNFRFDEYGLME